jgi:peptide subunit release factor 1 (eRF1)
LELRKAVLQCLPKHVQQSVGVVELAIEHALEEKSALEIVRSSAARRLMASIGPMAAMLRW